jgi:ABC-2 type transport system permease protein
MRRLISMTRALVLMTARQRQALFWNLAFPVIILTLLSLAFGRSTGLNVTVGVAGQGPVAAQVRAALASIKGVTVDTGSAQVELQALQKGTRDAVIDVPAGVPRASAPLPITLYYDQTNLAQSGAVVSLVSQVVNGLNQVLTHSRPVIALHEQGTAAVSNSYIDYLAPGIIAMSVMTASVIGIASRLAVWREQRILKRLRATPLLGWQFVAANVIAQMIVVLAQVLILTGLATTVFGVHLAGSLPLAIGLALLGGLGFLTIGFTISGLARTPDAAGAIANVVTMPMMFLSGVYFPISGAPDWLKPVIGVLPLTYLANGLRDVMLHGATVSDLTTDLVALLLTAALGFIVAARTFRWE